MGETGERAYIPKNIRQIGAPDLTKKIYVEDYVITYVNGIFDGGNGQEKVLLLFGGEALSGPCHYIYIRGAYEVEAENGGNKFFSSGDFQSAMEKSKEFFKDLPLIGWALIRQGQPVTFEEKMRTTWEAYMSRIPIFLLGDLLEKEEIFYWKYDGNVKAQPGYYVFYEKNKPMQEYMLSKKEVREIKPEEEAANRVIEGFRSRMEETQKNYEKAKANRMSIAVSIFLAAVVLSIGMTLLNNYEKMDEIQTSVNMLINTLTVKEQETSASADAGGTSQKEEESGENDIQPESQSGTQSESQQTSQPETQPETPAVTLTPRSHTVKKGETLLSIAFSIYGDANMMEEICQLNRISDPDAIFEGQELQLP